MVRIHLVVPEDIGMADREVLTVKEVQIVLGLSRTTVYARLQDRSIRSIKLEGRYLIPKQAIRELLEGEQNESLDECSPCQAGR